ncbi:hypothetical protein BH24GEM1_BH24GEM1_01870 [soil metagenome]
MSRERVRSDAALLQRPGSAVRCVDQGETVVVILEPYLIPVPEIYEPEQVSSLAFTVPTTYPEAQPDPTGFYLLPSNIVIRSSRQPPESTADGELLGAKWRKFSWAPKGAKWDPATDTLETYLSTVEARFLRRR